MLAPFFVSVTRKKAQAKYAGFYTVASTIDGMDHVVLPTFPAADRELDLALFQGQNFRYYNIKFSGTAQYRYDEPITSVASPGLANLVLLNTTINSALLAFFPVLNGESKIDLPGDNFSNFFLPDSIDVQSSPGAFAADAVTGLGILTVNSLLEVTIEGIKQSQMIVDGRQIEFSGEGSR